MTVSLTKVAAAVKQLKRLQKLEAFDPYVPESRPTPMQQSIIDEFGKISRQYCIAGNQCLTGDTLVATPNGPVRIDSIKVGDTVYSEYGEPIKVLKTFKNGPKEVADLTNRGLKWVSCTENHQFRISTGRGTVKEKAVKDFSRDDRVHRHLIHVPLGSVNVPEAYALGALLGDGCSRQPHRQLHISSGTASVPTKVASILGNTAIKLHENNYTWSVGCAEIPYYQEWCKGRYAHEKIVDLEVIKTWNRTSLLAFVAGLIDTDGSIHQANDGLTLSLGMQAKSVVDAFVYACLALWQIPLSRGLDARTTYKNGPVHEAYTRNANFVRTVLTELDEYLVSPQKKWKEEWESVGGKRGATETRVGLTWGFNKRIEETYDIHVDSPTNLYLLANGLVTHNSGKSQTGARLLTWLITETHPKWKRPASWGQEPLQALIVGRTTKIIEDVLWRKIEPFLEEGTYKVIRIGNTIQRVEMTNGNTMVFQSFENEESARERVQGYSANFVWLDEMPHSFKLWDELHKRIIAKNGYFLATFTPLIQNNEIRKTVDASAAPISKKYTFKMFDNPIYQDPGRQAAILKDMEHLPENVRLTRLEGAWSVADKSVFHFDPEGMVRAPKNYSPAWRHLEWSDPATESAHGLVIAAEDPATGHWYVIRAEYLSGIHVPERIFQTVMQRTDGLNIVRRVADPAATWYIHTASEKGVNYLTPFDKNSRKMELIKGLQTALGTRLFIAPWCQDLIDELLSCQYSETGKIVNGHRFHLLDAAQYGVDLLPAFEGPKVIRTWDQELYEGNEKRKKQEKQQKVALSNGGGRRLWKVSSKGLWRLR